MKAVVLAAGRGGRLSGVTGNHPKCLARVGSCTLLERQLASLRSCGLDAITVVVGCHAADVRRVCGRGVSFVHNTRFASTNNLYSLWLARDLLADGEKIGIARFGGSGASVLVEELDRLVGLRVVRDWLPAAFNAFCRRRSLWAVETRGFPWIEIDFPQDHWRACSEVLPAIEALDSPRPSTPAVERDASSAASRRTFHHV